MNLVRTMGETMKRNVRGREVERDREMGKGREVKRFSVAIWFYSWPKSKAN